MEQAQAAPQKLPKIGDILSVSWKATWANFGTFMKVVLPYIAIAVLQGILQIVWPNDVLNVLLAIVMIVVGIWASVLLPRISYQAVMSSKADFAAAQKDWGKVVWPMIVVSILVGFISTIGLVLLIIPGIILGLMYFSAVYLAVIDHKQIGESLSQSIQLSKGHKWDLFVKLLIPYLIYGIGFAIVGGILFSILAVIGNLFSEAAGPIIGMLTALFVAIPATPLLTNVKTYLFGHLKKLGGM